MGPRSWFFSCVALVAVMFFVGLAINVNTSSKMPLQMSSNSPAGTAHVIYTKIQSVKAFLLDRTLISSERCVPELNKIYDEMNSLNLTQFSLSDLKKNAPKLINELFKTRMELRENYQNAFSGENAGVSKECAFAHRRLFRAIRVFEDYIGMLHEDVFKAAGLPLRTDDKIYRVFEGNEINFLWNQTYRPTETYKYVPKSGDILLSRGSASVSASIARITDEDSNFSHAGIVYIDPVIKKIETIEAHIEYGSVVEDISHYKDMKARAVVFRFNDPKLSSAENAQIAHEAAAKVRNVILDYKKNKGTRRFPNVCYDFSMVIDNPTEFDPTKSKCLFCSEVISLAYKLVAGGKYTVPKFQSPIDPKNRTFLASIGATAKETFAPADLEIDPNFDMVMEWRDYRRIHRTHIMDAILTSVYGWMDEYNYQFQPPKFDLLKTSLAYKARRVPLLDRALKLDEKFPLNMVKSGLDAMLMLDEVANQLAAVIDKKEGGQGITLTPKEMLSLLEQWRLQDAKDYQSSSEYNKAGDILKDQRVHHFLRAPNSKMGK
ncbi:MAG: hypothetical protein JNL11_05785 [Bdellovibrionaceae bacterium]|nr:hypothetical protein [Pseudobdellovibrionaceae bacterium]